MYTLPVKQWFSHIHMPDRHSLAVKMDHLFHDERFWALVVAIALIAAFIGLVIWAGLHGEPGETDLQSYPFSPYNF